LRPNSKRIWQYLYPFEDGKEKKPKRQKIWGGEAGGKLNEIQRGVVDGCDEFWPLSITRKKN